jgi:hypothetical protein
VAVRVGEVGHRPAAVVELEGDVADRLPPAVEAQVQAQARAAGQPPAVDDPAAASRPADTCGGGTAWTNSKIGVKVSAPAWSSGPAKGRPSRAATL